MALNPEQVDKIREMLRGAGWNEVVRVAIQERAKVVNRLWRLLPSERPEPYRGLDDATVVNILRGRLEELEWFAAAFDNEVRVHDVNQRMDELQRDGATANP